MKFYLKPVQNLRNSYLLSENVAINFGLEPSEIDNIVSLH
jgi:hypothetical protein